MVSLVLRSRSKRLSTDELAGILYLCLNGRQAIVSLVSSLKTPSRTIRVSLVSTSLCIVGDDIDVVNGRKLSSTCSSSYSMSILQRGTPHHSSASEHRVCPIELVLLSQLTDPLLAVNTRVQIEVDSDTGLITNGRTNLFDQYLSFLLVVFIEAGFIEVSPPLLSPRMDADEAHRLWLRWLLSLTTRTARRRSRCYWERYCSSRLESFPSPTLLVCK